MSNFKTLDDVDVKGKRVLVRVDLNVPMDGGTVTDKTRVERVKPTILEIADKGGKVILLAHFGRPKGEIKPAMSLAQIIPAVVSTLGRDITFCTDCIGPMAEAAVSQMADGEIVLFENTRFHAGEESNDPEFAAALAANGDIFVSDAFSAAHRAHASTVGLARHMPAVAGRTMQAELEALNKALGNPRHPVIAVVGGAKVSTKLDLLKNLVARVDTLVIGGGMANTFLAAQGHDVQKSLCEHDLAATARDILVEAENQNCRILLPVDGVVASEFKAGAENHVAKVGAIPRDAMILDTGPQSVVEIEKAFEEAATLVWNGPLGAFEIQPFDTATVAAAKKAAELTKAGKLISVAGGGDTVSALNHAGVAEDFTYISTAGGAFLEWMEGKELPGVKVLEG
ncbi:phosphoglycerate kinase [Salaquimonas pukyongi]|uniref:phosphoglycerate kinase n=1 Tax=Salaquimonas pukyongi TaxID=2712698 RepID=UPI00096BBFE9|nr:phosphoglycerate kinase [Salaquimonas pukyongi]